MLFLAMVFPLAAQNATQILKDLVDADARNAERLNQYTYVQNEDRFWIDKNGKRTDETSTTDLMFVEGQRYAKLVARNGKPLDAKEEAKVEKQLKETAAQRRASRLSRMTHPSVSLGTHAELLTDFDSKVTGEDTISGRKVWVVECTPKPTAATGKHEKEVRNWRHKLWIDQQDHMAVKEVATVLGKGTFYVPGSSITHEYGRIADDVWGPSSTTLKGSVSFAKMFGGAVNTEYRFSDFKKFDVKSTITID